MITDQDSTHSALHAVRALRCQLGERLYARWSISDERLEEGLHAIKYVSHWGRNRWVFDISSESR